MKNVTLIHCYSDHNYGDLGIILSTVDLIQDFDEDFKINCVSTYNSSDERFKTEHVLLKERLNKIGGKVYPALFGIVDRTDSLYYLTSFLNLIRFLLILPFIKVSFIRRLFLTKQEESTYEMLNNSDIIVSKGGSFFCDDTGKLGSLSFFRLWYVALFSIKLNKKVVILAQSIGPLHKNFSKKFGNYLLEKLYKIVLREDYCLKKYPYLLNRDYLKNTDVVFFQKIFNAEPRSSTNGTVGVTIKYVDSDQDKYMLLMSKIVTYLVSQHGLNVKMLPQVPLDGDLKASSEVKNLVPIELHDKIEIVDDFHNVQKLIQEYSLLDFVVGTRLHSCIFSWSVNVPAINISYHGTKSKGVYANLRLEDWVLDYSSSDSFEKAMVLINHAIDNRDLIIENAQTSINKSRIEMFELLKEEIF